MSGREVPVSGESKAKAIILSAALRFFNHAASSFVVRKVGLAMAISQAIDAFCVLMHGITRVRLASLPLPPHTSSTCDFCV